MGCFSYCCVKSGKQIQAFHNVQETPWEFASKVIVLFKNGGRIIGNYDGYGGIDMGSNARLSLNDSDSSDWRMIIETYYEGEAFNFFHRPNPNGEDQGFSDPDTLEQEFRCGWVGDMSILQHDWKIINEYCRLVDSYAANSDYDSEERKRYTALEKSARELCCDVAAKIKDLINKYGIEKLTDRW